MPRIHLKPKSAEYADAGEQQEARYCDMPHCSGHAGYKAPRDRNLDGYYWFCLEHVQEYNKAWDYFSGMSAVEIEEHLIRSALWDRPTWCFSSFSEARDHLFRKAWQAYRFTEDSPSGEKETGRRPFSDNAAPEVQAMAVMGLEPPLDLKTIKARYKELAKKYHPDLNQGDREAEELLKSINMAYTILKLAFEQYEKLPQR